MHITASVFISDEYGLHQDYEKWLEEFAPMPRSASASPEAGCTTGPAKLASGKALS
jgi:hypothetical protein